MICTMVYIYSSFMVLFLTIYFSEKHFIFISRKKENNTDMEQHKWSRYAATKISKTGSTVPLNFALKAQTARNKSAKIKCARIKTKVWCEWISHLSRMGHHAGRACVLCVWADGCMLADVWINSHSNREHEFAAPCCGFALFVIAQVFITKYWPSSLTGGLKPSKHRLLRKLDLVREY